MRAMVSPVFTSGKLKLTVPHIDKCGKNIVEHLKTASVTGEVLEAREMYEDCSPPAGHHALRGQDGEDGV